MSDISVNISQGQIIVTDMNRGYSGISGVSGTSGFSGSNPGTSGVSGTSGKSGFSGRSGFSGTGTAGASGTSGYSGKSGISGISGTSGVSGVSGTSGASGTSGVSGGGGAWASWSPSWTNLAVGAGVVTAKYNQTGRVVTARFTLVWAADTSISGAVSFSLPVESVAYPASSLTQSWGTAIFQDTGTAQYVGQVLWATTTTAALRVETANTTYVFLNPLSSTVPFTWTTNDEINVQFTYEAV